MTDSRFAAVVPLARQTALKWQTSAAVQLAQWAVESAFGTRPSGTNNFFGIKARPGQDATTRTTQEQTASGHSYVISAGFANYPTAQAGFDAYGRLLGLGSFYRQATSTWMASARDLKAILAYVQGIKDAGYATAANYVSVISKTILDNDLAQFEPTPAEVAAYQKGNPMTTTAPAAPVVKLPAAVTASTPSASIQTSVKVGDALQVIFQLIDAAGEAGATVVEGLLPSPIKMMLAMFGGPTIIQGYIHQAMGALETQDTGLTVNVPTSNALVGWVVGLINANEPALVAELQDLEGMVQPLVTAYLAKLVPAS